MTDAANIHDTHPIPNDTVPSVTTKQRLALDSPDLPGSLVCPPSSTGPHLATPPYSLPEWITDTKIDHDRHLRRHETLAPAVRGRHDSQGSLPSTKLKLRRFRGLPYLYPRPVCSTLAKQACQSYFIQPRAFGSHSYPATAFIGAIEATMAEGANSSAISSFAIIDYDQGVQIFVDNPWHFWIKLCTNSQNQDLLEPKDVSAGPTNCKCTEHYRYAILSTVVPMPLDLCFEWLYSSQGFGYEDHLVRKAHAIVNSSLHIEISPWTKPQSETSAADTSEWETKRRELHYSVTFKVPMLSKTSTLCHETQEILEHSTHSICIHTESTTPNVLYGDMFSTVNQVCLTLESPGMTRIRCFAEVKFKKSILWSSRIEASAMQGCGSYYKELLRQLMEEPTLLQESHVVRPSVTRSNTTDSAQANQQLQYSSIAANLATSNTTTSLEAAPVMTRSSSQGFAGVSPAHSLLAQQYLKNPPTISKAAQVPTTSTDLCPEFISTSVTTTSNTSADNITPAGSSKFLTVERSAGFFWKSMVQTSVEFLSKSLLIIATSSKDRGTSPRGHDSHIQGDTDISSKRTPPQDNNQSSTAVSSMDGSIRAVEADGSAQESTVTSVSPDILSTVESDTDAIVSRQPISPIQASSKALWLVLAVAMVMSVLNLWCLFRTVSSMANVIHNSRHARPSTTRPLYHHWLDGSGCFHDGGIGSFQMFSTHWHSLPLHVQADMLRCEMDDLTQLLQIVQRRTEK
ncbi:hypothetical protein BGZ47_004264 [Haplosporangium gracile]|nr:hypothetical protein BGZ47_004264 [Haplosporangium gracile]